jgi:hypothetical protein
LHVVGVAVLGAAAAAAADLLDKTEAPGVGAVWGVGPAAGGLVADLGEERGDFAAATLEIALAGEGGVARGGGDQAGVAVVLAKTGGVVLVQEEGVPVGFAENVRELAVARGCGVGVGGCGCCRGCGGIGGGCVVVVVVVVVVVSLGLEVPVGSVSVVVVVVVVGSCVAAVAVEVVEERVSPPSGSGQALRGRAQSRA